ncbi:polysaccharide pyruvyl transferase family protein [Paenibacillus sp. N4]|uniref:polysaccharide pyruvyl transferase family protein n=1 Tax=Paenibacillus vietnamensis TaxID=2590547 RepID=UPI001CD11971|nr:polysaccharide pyruvyl transferase family protein [Paenibacillus vietnamensis]MCA0756490.1 polysaccharide pyruvyl transferase family protein [Paenibacillus vietnamensis]
MANINASQNKSLIRKKLYLRYLLSNKGSKFFNVDKEKKKIIVSLAADYGNLGDVAITYAQTMFLKNNFPEYEVIDFPISRTFKDMKALKKICTPNDIITIVGGGNTGDMYDDIEYCRQFIINQFPQNRIISFPQTIDFSETANGKKALQRAISVYSKHKNLVLTAREEKSFKKYQESFTTNKVLFVPDIVLSLDEQESKYQRDGITMCLRSDREKRVDKSQQNLLETELKKSYKVNYYDTHINKDQLSIQERELELKQIWTVFKKSKIVITDRLHGMIFCAITKTPCIALDNSNHKISGVYNAWLKGSKYIKMVEHFNVEELQKEIEHLWNIDSNGIAGVNLNDKFKSLINV